MKTNKPLVVIILILAIAILGVASIFIANELQKQQAPTDSSASTNNLTVTSTCTSGTVPNVVFTWVNPPEYHSGVTVNYLLRVKEVNTSDSQNYDKYISTFTTTTDGAGFALNGAAYQFKAGINYTVELFFREPLLVGLTYTTTFTVATCNSSICGNSICDNDELCELDSSSSTFKICTAKNTSGRQAPSGENAPDCHLTPTPVCSNSVRNLSAPTFTQTCNAGKPSITISWLPALQNNELELKIAKTSGIFPVDYWSKIYTDGTSTISNFSVMQGRGSLANTPLDFKAGDKYYIRVRDEYRRAASAELILTINDCGTNTNVCGDAICGNRIGGAIEGCERISPNSSTYKVCTRDDIEAKRSPTGDTVASCELTGNNQCNQPGDNDSLNFELSQQCTNGTPVVTASFTENRAGLDIYISDGTTNNTANAWYKYNIKNAVSLNDFSDFLGNGPKISTKPVFVSGQEYNFSIYDLYHGKYAKNPKTIKINACNGTNTPVCGNAICEMEGDLVEKCEKTSTNGTSYKVCTNTDRDLKRAPTGHSLSNCQITGNVSCQQSIPIANIPKPTLGQQCLQGSNVVNIAWDSHGEPTSMIIFEGVEDNVNYWIKTFFGNDNNTTNYSDFLGRGNKANKSLIFEAGKNYTVKYLNTYWGGSFSQPETFTANNCSTITTTQTTVQCNQDCNGTSIICASGLTCTSGKCRRSDNPSSTTCAAPPAVNSGGGTSSGSNVSSTLPETAIGDDYRMMLIGMIFIIIGIIIYRKKIGTSLALSMINKVNENINDFTTKAEKAFLNSIPYEERIDLATKKRHKAFKKKKNNA